MARDMENQETGLVERMINVNRVVKVVKGGRIMAFSALTIVGDTDGGIGMGKGKAKEVPVAVQKAMDQARKSLIKYPLRNGTLHHSVMGQHGATQVFIQPAKEGTGIIAGGPMRAIFDAMGIKNVSAKIRGSTNPHNVVRATLNGLAQLRTPSQIASKRGKTVEDLIGISDE
jgi:small subunit ribosomal protein S5